MPSVSRAQQRLMQAAEHGATFPKARKLRASMSHQQLHDFASGSEQGKPQHVDHESYAYNWRSRNNLKQHQPKKGGY